MHGSPGNSPWRKFSRFAAIVLLVTPTSGEALEDPAVCGMTGPGELRRDAAPYQITAVVCNEGDEIGSPVARWRLSAALDSLNLGSPVRSYVLADSELVGLPEPGNLQAVGFSITPLEDMAPGTYRWRIDITPLGDIADADFSNNSLQGPTIRLRGPDLRGLQLEGPAEAAAGDTTRLFYAYRNSGVGTAGPHRIRFGLALSAANPREGIAWLGPESDASGGALDPPVMILGIGHLVRLPEDVPPGPRIWVMEIDYENAVPEEEEANNLFLGNAAVPVRPVSWGAIKRGAGRWAATHVGGPARALHSTGLAAETILGALSTFGSSGIGDH